MNLEIQKLIDSGQWPKAVPEEAIAGDSQMDKELRAASVVEMIDVSFTGKKILDFGCGDGLVDLMLVRQGAASVVGYDPDNSQFIEKTDNLNLTNDMSVVHENGPYELVIIHDVIDHTTQNILYAMKPLLQAGGRVFLRCHPWISRHGGHMYREKNLAFIHFLLEPSELKELGLDQKEHLEVLYPTEYYEEQIEMSGFNILSTQKHTTDVEPFFYDVPVVRDRIKKWYKTDIATDLSNWHLQTNFVDYILQLSAKELKRRASLAKWDFYIHGRFDKTVVMWPDGTLNDRPDCCWIMHGNTIVFKWKDNSAPNGFWVDIMELSPDRTKLKGQNQTGTALYADRK